MTLVKICGLMRPQDADAVNAAKADFAGFILSAGFRRSIDRALASQISARLNPSVKPVGVFVDEPLDFIISFAKTGVIEVVQLHGRENDAYIAQLRELLPETTIVKAFKAQEDDTDRINACAADLVLLDSGQGTGETFDWAYAVGIERPYMLAGGLGPGNVSRAVMRLDPYAVDMSSGVETNGQKDPEKIMEAVKGAKHD